MNGLIGLTNDNDDLYLRAQSSGCSSTSNAHNETGQMAVCCQNLTLGALRSRGEFSMLVGAQLKGSVSF